MRFRVMRFRAPPVAPPSGALADGGGPAVLPLPPLLDSGERGCGHPTAESQQAGLDHLIRIAMEQAEARRCSPTEIAGTDPACGDDRAGPDPELPGDEWDGTPEAYRPI